MRALVFHGESDIRYETVPDPEPPGADGLVLRVERAAICGSDLHLYHGHMPLTETGFAVGHEFVGEVMEVGSEIRSVRPGDRVWVAGVIGCGRCDPCRRGEVVRCREFLTRVFGFANELPGGQAEAVAVPAADHIVRKIHDGISVEQAVLLTDILPTGYFGAAQAGIRPGQDVAVVGAGPVGLMAMMCAQLFGPARLFAIDALPERLAHAEALGAIPVLAENADAVLAEATELQGVDVVIEAVGADQTILKSIEWVARGGCVSVIGVNMRSDFPFPMASALMKDLTFKIGLCPVPETWDTLVPLVASGRLKPELVFTHHLPLSEGAEAYRIFEGRKDGVLKVLLDPSA